MSIFDLPNPTVTKTIRVPLTAATTVAQGDLLCGNPATGMAVAAASADDTMIAIGFAARAYVGDGVTPVEIELFQPTYLCTFKNDAGSVAFAFTPCYAKDAQSVTATEGTPQVGLATWRSSTLVTVAVRPAFSFVAPPAP